MPPRVAPLSPRDESAALAFLDRKPYENVFLHWLVKGEGGVPRTSLYVYRDEDERVRGVAFYGRQIVVAADSDQVVDAFADAAPVHGRERMIVGERPIVERFWQGVRERHAPARVVRDSQPVFALEPAWLHTPEHRGVSVRRAAETDAETVARNSAQMILHELEYDPRRERSDFEAGVSVMIRQGLWWVGEHEGEICFFCNAGPRSPYTLQLQGIWTPPKLRGKGLAGAALAQICRELLQTVPTLSLYVNAFNEPAIALYERTGFKRVAEFSTLLF